MSGRDYQRYDAVIETPLPGRNNRLAIVTQDDKLQELLFVSQSTKLKQPKTTVAKTVVEQLKAYFSDSDFKFTLPLEPQGTLYQKRVWDKLRKCPTGKVWTYGDLARKIHSAPRAVGNACRRNPIPIVVPCHRVVSANGMGGYAGHTSGTFLSIKQWLLQHESII
ncbi:methylated-DNA--[protein]-cysteine S-methyltransferase [Kaarinaea lacus]